MKTTTHVSWQAFEIARPGKKSLTVRAGTGHIFSIEKDGNLLIERDNEPGRYVTVHQSQVKAVR